MKYIQGVHHIAMSVSNFEQSIHFYQDVLGFTPVMQWGEGDGRAVMLDTGDGSCLELFANGTGRYEQEGAWKHLAFRVSDCDAVYEAALAAGAASQTAPKDVELQTQPVTPVRIAFVTGLDGEVIEFFQLR